MHVPATNLQGLKARQTIAQGKRDEVRAALGKSNKSSKPYCDQHGDGSGGHALFRQRTYNCYKPPRSRADVAARIRQSDNQRLRLWLNPSEYKPCACEGADD